MPILVSCSCGKKLKVRDELVGKKVKCPACGGVLAVAAEVVEAEVLEEDDSPATSQPPARQAPARKPPPLPGPSAPPRPPKETEQPAADKGLGVWRCTGGGQSRLLCLTDEGAFFADADKKTLKRIEADLADGESPQDALGDKPGFIPWEVVTKVDSNLKRDNFAINFKTGDDDSSQNFRFEDKRDRTDALKWMRDHLAPDFTYKRRELTSLQATFKPLLYIGGLIAVFAFLVWFAWSLQQPREGGGRVRGIGGIIIYYTVGWLGPIWTGVLGGVCVLGCVAWMAVRIADPPIEVTITPTPEKKKPEVEEEEDEEEEEERPRSKDSRRRSRDDED